MKSFLPISSLTDNCPRGVFLLLDILEILGLYIGHEIGQQFLEFLFGYFLRSIVQVTVDAGQVKK